MDMFFFGATSIYFCVTFISGLRLTSIGVIELCIWKKLRGFVICNLIAASNTFYYLSLPVSRAIYDTTGVFVLVTIGLSTISVVTSILIIRLSGVSTPLPGWICVGAFRSLARIMCVRFSLPPPTSAVAPYDDRTTTASTELVSGCEENIKSCSNDSRDIGNKLDDVLQELRKVCLSSCLDLASKFVKQTMSARGPSNIRLYSTHYGL